MKKPRNKHKVFLIFFLLLATVSFSQTEEDYLNTLEVIKKGLNEGNTSLIYEQFTIDLKSSLEKEGLGKMLDSVRKESGKMQSYDLILAEDTFKNYLVEFESTSLLIVLGIAKEGISKLEIKNY